MPRRIAFYPCCARDIDVPLQLLSGVVDIVYFCDKNPSLLADWRSFKNNRDDYPEVRFLCLDALEALNTIERIDVLFYRRDSNGEGGSAIYILGKRILPLILKVFPSEGGLIITDGSNSGSHVFKKMLRPDGLRRFGWLLKPTIEQRFRDSHGLWTINAIPDCKEA